MYISAQILNIIIEGRDWIHCNEANIIPLFEKGSRKKSLRLTLYCVEITE